MLNVYLAGEIHSNWREEIIQLCEKEKLDVKFTSPITDHEASDNCLLYTSPSPRDVEESRMPSSA